MDTPPVCPNLSMLVRRRAATVPRWSSAEAFAPLLSFALALLTSSRLATWTNRYFTYTIGGICSTP